MKVLRNCTKLQRRLKSLSILRLLNSNVLGWIYIRLTVLCTIFTTIRNFRCFFLGNTLKTSWVISNYVENPAEHIFYNIISLQGQNRYIKSLWLVFEVKFVKTFSSGIIDYLLHCVVQLIKLLTFSLNQKQEDDMVVIFACVFYFYYCNKFKMSTVEKWFIKLEK